MWFATQGPRGQRGGQDRLGVRHDSPEMQKVCAKRSVPHVHGDIALQESALTRCKSTTGSCSPHHNPEFKGCTFMCAKKPPKAIIELRLANMN